MAGRNMPPWEFERKFSPERSKYGLFLAVNQPSFTAKKNINKLATVTDSGFGNLPYSLSDRAIIPMVAIIINFATLHYQTAPPTYTDLVCRQQILHRLTRLERPQNFFLIIYCNISLSRLSPATRPLRR